MKNYILLIIVSLMLLLASCKQEKMKSVDVKREVTEQVINKLCFVKRIYRNERYHITVDFIDRSKISELDPKASYAKIIELPDSSCYLNKEEMLEDYEFADSVKIIMQTFSRDAEGNYNFKQSITLTNLFNGVEKQKHAVFLSSPYEIEIYKKKIISLKEIYIP